MNLPTVVIEVNGGVATVAQIPEGIRVVTRDFDVENYESCSCGSDYLSECLHHVTEEIGPAGCDDTDAWLKKYDSER